MAMTNQNDVFQQRLKRITDPRNKSYLDLETGMQIPRRVSRDKIGKNTGQKRTFVNMIAALGLGVGCLAVARYVRFTHLEMSAFDLVGMTAEVAMACIAAMLLGVLLRQKSLGHMGMHVFGAALAAVAMHNAVWIAPDQFASVFTQGYVDQILTATAPMSLQITGASIPMPSAAIETLALLAS